MTGVSMVCLLATEDNTSGIILSPVNFVQQAIMEIDEQIVSVTQPASHQNRHEHFGDGN